MSKFSNLHNEYDALTKALPTGEIYAGKKVYAEQVATMPVPINAIYDYDSTSGQLLYNGFSVPGTGEDAPGWRVRRYVYGPNGALLKAQWALGADGKLSATEKWSDRITLTYQ